MRVTPLRNKIQSVRSSATPVISTILHSVTSQKTVSWKGTRLARSPWHLCACLSACAPATASFEAVDAFAQNLVLTLRQHIFCICGLFIYAIRISTICRKYFVKMEQHTKYQFHRSSKKVAPFYIWQMLLEVGYHQLSWLFLRVELSSFSIS